MKRIYVCSRYRGDVQSNVERALQYCREIALSGGIPICPHVYFTRFLNDCSESERNAGIAMGMELLGECDAMYVYTVDGDLSDGMEAEIAYAKQLCMDIRYFRR